MAASEAEDSAPRAGTIAWLQLQDVIAHSGRMVPVCHRIPEGASLTDPEPGDRRCTVMRASGERCGAPATKAFGLCLIHAGGGGLLDASGMAKRSHKTRAKLRLERQMLGITPSGRAEPRQLARLAALRRSAELASALVDGPLDDPELSSLSRQKAALTALDATFPIQTAELTVELPGEAEGVASMGWQELQQLAAVLLRDDPSLDS